MDFKELLTTVQGLKENIAKSGIYNFTPHKKQQLFLTPDRDVFPKIRVAQAGNRGGKTEIGMIEDWSFSQGERPFDGTKTPCQVPNRGRIVTTSFLDGIKKVIEPKIRQLWPEESIASKKIGQHGAVTEVVFKNGSMVDFLSYEQQSMKHEGADLDWIHFDEPPSREHYIANTRGLVDRGGYAWFTMTPLSEPWILDEIINKAMKNDPDHYFVQWSIYDNIGFGLTAKNVKAFENTLTEDEKAVRLYGNWLVLQGLVYKEWKDHYYPEGHVIKSFPIPEHWPRYVGVDPHDRTPTHVVWAAVDERQNVFFYDELILANMTIKDMAEAIKEREAQQDEPINPQKTRVMRLIDPAAARKTNIMELGDNIKDQFLKHGLFHYSAINDLAAGHKQVRSFLKFEETNVGASRPRMFMFDTLKATRHSFNRYIYDEWVGPSRDKKELREKPRDKDKHGVDVCRYILMSNPRYFEHLKRKHKGYQPDSERTGY